MIYFYYAFLLFFLNLSVIGLIIGFYHADIFFTITGALCIFASFITYLMIKEIRKDPFDKQ